MKRWNTLQEDVAPGVKCCIFLFYTATEGHRRLSRRLQQRMRAGGVERATLGHEGQDSAGGEEVVGTGRWASREYSFAACATTYRWRGSCAAERATARLWGVLIRSAGEAVLFGSNGSGRCAAPALPRGTLYVQAATGVHHTSLIRSDDEAVLFGKARKLS